MKTRLSSFPLYLAIICMVSTALAAPSHASEADPSPSLAEAGSVTVHTQKAAYDFTFSPRQAESRFIADFIRWAREDGTNLPRRDAVLAVGSSSMRTWHSIHTDLAPLDIIHRGFGGSQMGDVLLMVDFFQRYDARTILVYQGDNDLAGDQSDVDQFIAKCRDFIDAMRETRPDVEIFFIAIKPSPARATAQERFSTANDQLSTLCRADPKLHFIDIFNPMLDTNGHAREELFIHDRLHMNETGYELWTQSARKSLQLP